MPAPAIGGDLLHSQPLHETQVVRDAAFEIELGLGEFVDVNILGRVTVKNLQGPFFVLGVFRLHPQEDPAAFEMLLQVMRVMAVDYSGEHRPDEPTGAAADCRAHERGADHAARGHDGAHGGDRADISEASKNPCFRLGAGV